MSGRRVLIRGARLLGGPTEPTSLLLADGRVASVGDEADEAGGNGIERIDADGLLAAPGFIELQVNGGFGHDLTADPGSIWVVGEGLARSGVTAFLPTIVSSPPAVVTRARAILAAGPPAGYRGAMPLGLHLEGPFLRPEKRGAHREEHIRLPDLEAISDWSPTAGVRLVTLAPELPGALDAIRFLTSTGVVVSAGHSLASLAEGEAAIEAGVRYGTHLFNAMPPLDHREPGLAAALLKDARVVVGIIADGVHLARATVDLVWRMAGPARTSVVSDAIAGLGTAPGRSVLGDLDVDVQGIVARTPDGRLAGGLLDLAAGVRNLAAFTGAAASEAVATVTTTPAQLLGLTDRDSLEPGSVADLVLLTDDLRVQITFVAGEPVGEPAR